MSEIKYLKKKELKKLFTTIEDSKERQYYLRDLAIFNLAYYCGLRISEVGLIKLEDYNKETGSIYIRRLKGSNNSTIYLDKERRLLLNRYIRIYKINNNDFLFTTKSGKQIKKSSIKSIANYYKTKANLLNFHFHMLKHSIAVHLLEIGLSIFEVKNYLGHKRITSTLVYASFSDDMNKEMYNKINKGQLVH